MELGTRMINEISVSQYGRVGLAAAAYSTVLQTKVPANELNVLYCIVLFRGNPIVVVDSWTGIYEAVSPRV